MTQIRTLDDVTAYLLSIPEGAPVNHKWRAVRTVTHRLMRAHGLTNASTWSVEALPQQAYSRYGDCNYNLRRIRYRRRHVEDWWPITLAATIVHEVAHAVTGQEMRRQGRPGSGGHGRMWRGQATVMGLLNAQAHNLPKEEAS